MLLFQDGSRFAWLPGGDRELDLIVMLDDATSEIYSAFLVEEEGTASSFVDLAETIAARGLFCEFYTDRGSHYFHTPEAGGKVDWASSTLRVVRPRRAGPLQGRGAPPHAASLRTRGEPPLPARLARPRADQFDRFEVRLDVLQSVLAVLPKMPVDLHDPSYLGADQHLVDIGDAVDMVQYRRVGSFPYQRIDDDDRHRELRRAPVGGKAAARMKPERVNPSASA
jgi:hypothetical protein